MRNSTTTTSTMIKNFASVRNNIAGGGGEGRMPFTRDYFFYVENVTEGMYITNIFANRRTKVSYAKVKKDASFPVLLSYFMTCRGHVNYCFGDP